MSTAAPALESVLAQRTAALSSGKADGYRDSIATLLDTTRHLVAGPVREQDAAE